MSAIYEYASDLWREFKSQFVADLEDNYSLAVQFTEGNLLNAKGVERGIHDRQLFVSGPDMIERYASDELRKFWESKPRPMSGKSERRWLTERLGHDAPGLVPNSDSAIFSWASAVWKKCRAEYDVELEARYAAAEEATKGQMVNARGREIGVSSWSLMMGNSGFVKAYGTEELVDYWRVNPRMTFARFESEWFDGFVAVEEAAGEGDLLFDFDARGF